MNSQIQLNRWLYLAALVLVLLVILACGPADQSVQRQLGDSPNEAPTQFPLQVAQPPEAAAGAAQDEASPTPTVTPIPTVCFPWPTEWEGANESGVMCVHTSPQLTPRYPKLMGEIGATARASDGGGGGAGGESDDKLFHVSIVPAAPDDLDVITSWLDERGIGYTVLRGEGHGPIITTALTGAEAGPLSDLPEVARIDDKSTRERN